MVLKFCKSPWKEERELLSNHNLDEDQAIAERRRTRAELARDELLVTTLRVYSEYPCRWEKEFSVVFDDSKPVGLGFQPLMMTKQLSLGPGESYACIIRDIAPAGLAADYNARCRAAGDYSRIIVDELRVRMVNGNDVANIAYADVLQMMRDAKPALTLTLADINSGLVNSGLEERSNSTGSLAAVRQSRRRSSLSMGSGQSFARRNSLPVQATKSECTLVPDSVDSNADGSDTLMNDSKVGHIEVSEQLNFLRRQLSTMQQEREEAVKKEQEIAARQLETLLQETHKVQQERDDMVAVNKLLLRYKRASVTKQDELEMMKREQVQVQRQQEELERTLKKLQVQLVEQTKATEESREQVIHLRHEKENLALQWQELQEEHRDALKQVDELHDRLVDAQRAHRAVEVVLAALRAGHAHKTRRVQELQTALDVANSQIIPTDETRAPAEISKFGVVLQQTIPQADTKGSVNRSVISALLTDANIDLNLHRSELVAQLLCYDQQQLQLQDQVHALDLVNTTSKQLLASLHEELRVAQNRERSMCSEFSAELEVVRKNVEQEARIVQNDLRRQVTELEQRCEVERTEKNRIQVTLDDLESAGRTHADQQAKEEKVLAQFKRQLESGIVVAKFGARGAPHQRVVYADAQCLWLSWRPSTSSGTYSSLMPAKIDDKVDTCDLVEVLPGATTENFARQRPDAPARCFSLVFVHPCRTLDLQADTASQCQQYVRGFRLLQKEVALKRYQQT